MRSFHIYYLYFKTIYVIVQERIPEKPDNKCKEQVIRMQHIFRQTKPHISYFIRATLDYPAHVHDDIELVYVRRGSGTACCDGKKYALSEGAVFLVFPNQVHYYTNFEAGDYLVLIMKPSNLLRYGQIFMAGEPANAQCCFFAGKDDGILWLMETAHREFLRDGYSDIIAAYLTALFGKLLRYFKIEKADVSHGNVLKILQYCSSHYKEELSVDMVAENLGISSSCVSHIFSARICMHFCDYINSLRLKEAEEILRNTQYAVTEVANLSGFSTIRTFNRAFLKKYGISPSEYRKNYRKDL